MTYRDDAQTLRERVRSLEREVERLRADNARLEAEDARRAGLSFDPRSGCLHCGGDVEQGALLGGKGLLGWHPAPMRMRWGMALDVEWLTRPGFLKPAPQVRALRCARCRKVYADY